MIQMLLFFLPILFNVNFIDNNWGYVYSGSGCQSNMTHLKLCVLTKTLDTL